MGFQKGTIMFNINPDWLAFGFVVAPATIGGVIAVVQSKYSHEVDQKPRQEPSFSHKAFELRASDRREPTFDKV